MNAVELLRVSCRSRRGLCTATPPSRAISKRVHAKPSWALSPSPPTTWPLQEDQGHPNFALPFLCDSRRERNPTPPLLLLHQLRITTTSSSTAALRIESSRRRILPQSRISLSPGLLIWPSTAILSPSPRKGLFHDPYTDPNEQHRPSQSSRHTLNPTGARASEEEEGRAGTISTIVL